MEKKKILHLLILLLIGIICNNINILLYPYHFIKDLVYYPVNAIKENGLSDLEEGIIEGLKKDNAELLKLNGLTLSLNDFNMINATIIERNREYWFNSLTINKGGEDGINLDMAVIDINGLVGRISNLTDHTATVKLITTNDIKNKVSALINTSNGVVYGIINGYDNKDNLLQLIINENNQVIKKGDSVETTGMGGVFPRNILIGKVLDMIKDDDGVTNIVRVIPAANIEGERYVTILQRKEILDN